MSAAMNPEAGDFEGVANATGRMDRGGDVIAPGAFAPSLAAFLRTGFLSLSHDWEALPVAMPTAAQERDGGLWVRARYHSTPAAQAARRVVTERLGAGLAVGLSVGFRTDPADCKGFRSGEALASYVRRAGLGGFDEAEISAWDRPCRLVERVAELFEVSIVAVPMNSGSRVTGAAPRELRTDWTANALRLAKARLQEVM